MLGFLKDVVLGLLLLWPKATWGDNGLFGLPILNDTPLRDASVGTQTGHNLEAGTDASLRLMFLSPWPTIPGWYHPQWVGIISLSKLNNALQACL